MGRHSISAQEDSCEYRIQWGAKYVASAKMLFTTRKQTKKKLDGLIRQVTIADINEILGADLPELAAWQG